ncbi:hypothetical protein F2P81_016554 [Scophthalmus maximus]|uniref:Gamma-aminobutyric acid type B receptor subunit 2 n=1 Tax=Scophthalmus maximus TaxID=52904 RepID=A0A6A4SHL8_SCOMX|nr:hypothetical protein F2P81_016554 [Scophthalmus maximus]
MERSGRSLLLLCWLTVSLVTAQCDPAQSLKALFDAMWAGPKYLMVFGGVCPSVTSLIARSLPALNLVQVSFDAPPPGPANRKWYGNLFSTMPSDRAVNQAAVKLLQRHKWTRVGIVTQETPRLLQMKKDLMRQLLKADVQTVSTESLSDDVCSSVKTLKDRDVRIIIGQFEEDSASEVFCCAYRLNLFGARYQWIVVDGGTGGWRPGRPVSDCTADSVLTAADGSIRLQIRPLGKKTTAGVSGRTPQSYQEAYLGQLVQDRSQPRPLHAFAYDAVWVAASALGRVTEAAKHRERYDTQRNVTLSEEEELKLLLEAVKNTQLEGVTGPVFFRNGERMSTTELIQLQGPGPARDQNLLRLQRRHVNLLQYGIVSSAAALTIVITLIVLFIVLHRKHCPVVLIRTSALWFWSVLQPCGSGPYFSPVVLIRTSALWFWSVPQPCDSPSVLRLLKSSGGSQDELLLLGLLLSSSSVLLSAPDGASVSDRTFEILCSARLWTLSAGQTLSAAVLLIRTWTAYFLCCVRQKSDPSDPDVVLQPFSDHCSSSNVELWLRVVCGYRGPLLGLGCFLAWNIRSTQVGHVSGQRLALSVFAVTAFGASGATASLLTSHNPPVHFCLSGALVLGCNVCVLNSQFGPTILHVSLNGSETQPPSEVEEEEEEEDEQLTRSNLLLKSRTSQLDVEIETITTQLLESEMRTNIAEVRSVSWLDEDLRVCADDRSSGRKRPHDVNSPELMWRRLSVQLPILHLSYLPAIGGVKSSSSSLFGSRDAFIHHHEASVTTRRSCPPDDTHLEPDGIREPPMEKWNFTVETLPRIPPITKPEAEPGLCERQSVWSQVEGRSLREDGGLDVVLSSSSTPSVRSVERRRQT